MNIALDEQIKLLSKQLKIPTFADYHKIQNPELCDQQSNNIQGRSIQKSELEYAHSSFKYK